MKISEVTIGDHLHVWMKPGAPLTLVREAKGRLRYDVAKNVVTRQKHGQFVHFSALVTRNDPANKLLHVTATPMWNHHKQAVGQSLPAVIHYSTLSRVHFVLPYSIPGDPPSTSRPTSVSPLSNLEKKPYKTVVRVNLR